MPASLSGSVGRWFAGLAAALSLMEVAHPILASNKFWDAPLSLDFDDGNAWTGGNIPAIDGSDSVRFNLDDKYAVQFDSKTDLTYGGPPHVNNLFVTDGVVSLLTTETPRRSLIIDGPGGANSATIDGGTLYLGTKGDDDAAFELEAVNSIAVASGELTVWSGSRAVANFFHIAANGGTGTLLVAGSDASVHAPHLSVASIWGSFGGTANITFDATGGAPSSQLGDVDMAVSSFAGTTADVRVNSRISLADLRMATVGGATTSATLTIDGADALVSQVLGASLNVGHSDSGSAVIHIRNGGQLHKRSGGTTIHPTGEVHVTDGGIFTAFDDILVDGGLFNLDGGTLDLAFGRDLTVVNGGSFTTDESYTVDNSSAFIVNSGGTMNFHDELHIAHNSDGSLLLDGTGSIVTISPLLTSLHEWGSSGNAATVSLTNGAELHVTNGAWALAQSTTAGTSADVTVASGSTMTVDGTIQLVVAGGATTSATLTVEGTDSTFSQLGNHGLNVGDLSSGSAVIHVTDRGTFTTGTGLIWIADTGEIHVDDHGTFNANGNVIIHGGTLTRNFNSDFNLAPGKNLTIRAGGSYQADGTVELEHGSTFEILSGGNMAVDGAARLNIAATEGGGDGTLLIDGNGSNLSTQSSQNDWGMFGNTATVTVSNEASMDIGSIFLADAAFDDLTQHSTASLNVLSGADVTVTGSIWLANNGSDQSNVANLTIDGSGATLTQINSGFSTIRVGDGGGGSGVIDVVGGGILSTGAVLTEIRATGQINLASFLNFDNGTWNADGEIEIDGGALNVRSGTFNLAAGHSVEIHNGGTFVDFNHYAIDDDTTFDIHDGGSMSVQDALDIGGFSDGSLTVDGAGSSVSIGADSRWAFGGAASVRLQNEAALQAAGIDLAGNGFLETTALVEVLSGADMTVDGHLAMAILGGDDTSATINVFGDGSTVTQTGDHAIAIGHPTDGAALLRIGDGGVFHTGTGDITVFPTGRIHLTSTSTPGVLNANGRMIVQGQVEVNQLLGTPPFGGGTLNTNDELRVDGGSIALGPMGVINGGLVFLTADGALDATGGTLNAGTGLVVDAGANFNLSGSAVANIAAVLAIDGGELNISGGTMTVAGDIDIDNAAVHLNGGTLSANQVTPVNGGTFNFTGGVLHADVITASLTNEGGTLAPGESADSTTIFGDYTQQAGAALEIEIGGTIPGSGHDLVSVVGNAILDGALQLALLGAFTPQPTDTFMVLNSNNILGLFSNVATGERLDTLDGRGSFVVHYGAGSAFETNLLVLTDFEPAATIPGDFNNDGEVDAADYVVWRKNQGSQAEYDLWRAHFGQSAGGAGAGSWEDRFSTVPEPTCLFLAFGCLLQLCLLRSRKR